MTDLAFYKAYKKIIKIFIDLNNSKKYFISKTMIVPFEKVIFIETTKAGFFWVFYSSKDGDCCSVDDSQLENYLNYLNKRK